jgi:Ca2+-binding RTX toxin-like protein
MAITASYSSGTRKLSVLGDAASNSIIFSRDLAGLIFVNAGAVPVTGGPATTANTDLIEVFGLDLNDVITLDESNGALPAASMFGGNGNDTLTGGSSGDTLNGDAGADTLIGNSGVDTLNGGADGDTLTGGAGDDVMNGEAGNDRMIWNPGDGSDVMEGGADSDIAEVNGNGSGEIFSIDQNGTRVSLRRTSGTSLTLDIGTTESLVLNANGGDDLISSTGNLIGLIGLTLDGGAGDDTISGSNGNDLLLGGDNNDFVDGNAGADTAFLGAGNDTFKWDPGDGSDIVEGQSDTDLLLFNGSNASEAIDITPNGGRTRFFRDVAAIAMDLNAVEQILYKALNGSDRVTIGDLTGTATTSVTVDLSGAADANFGDNAFDIVTVNGTGADDTITAAAGGGTINVTGVPAAVSLIHPDTNDRLILAGGSGNDTITASGIAAGIIIVEMQGSVGGDTFIGSEGADLITGGDGNDTALMGAGNDVFTWNPGDDNDVVEGQADLDTLNFNGNSSVESFTISNNGGRVLLFRDVAAVTMDLNEVEQVTVAAGAGADVFTLNDLSATDVQLVTLNLAATIGGGTADGAVDAITAHGRSGADTIALSGSTSISATGLPYSLNINQAEAIDTLLIAAGAAADNINASALAAGLITLTLNGEAGADVIVGSAGADLINGSTEDDTIAGGAGNDTMNGEDGNDRMFWNDGDGSDVMEGGNGTGDLAQVNGGTGAEAFTIAANGARVSFQRISPGPFLLDIGTTEHLVLNAGDGDDTVSASGNLAALIELSLDGGDGNDTILAGNGNDVLIGGSGDDFVDGNQGIDIAVLGDGNDVFQWDPGDGNDNIDGQQDNDALIFNGNGANELFSLSPSGGKALMQRDVGLITMDTDNLEQFVINAGAGTDQILLGDMTGTEANTASINLSGTIGGSSADGVIDTVTVAGNGLDNLITILGAGSACSIAGLPLFVSVTQTDSTDQLILNAGAGNDFISATSLGSGVMFATLNGEAGNDTILGGAGGDFLNGGDNDDLIDGNQGADTAFLGLGNDAFVWDPGDGSDVVEGQGGNDTLIFNGSNANEVISISPNGGRSLVTRDVGSIIMDMDDMETLTVNTFGGSDIITIANLAGTDVTRVVVNLAAASGGGDGLADTVTVNASAIGDIVDVDVNASGFIVVTGLFATVEIRNFDAKDRLVLNLGDGNDTLDATGVPLALTVFGGIGDDSVTGGAAHDIIQLGAGNNIVLPSPGGDLVDSTGGTTTLFI